MVVSNPTSTVTVGDGGVSINNGPSSSGTASQKSKESEGLTTANKIAIGLAIPGALAGIVTLILAWRKCKNRRQKKTESKPQMGGGYGQSEAVDGSRWARRY